MNRVGCEAWRRSARRLSLPKMSLRGRCLSGTAKDALMRTKKRSLASRYAWSCPPLLLRFCALVYRYLRAETAVELFVTEPHTPIGLVHRACPCSLQRTLPAMRCGVQFACALAWSLLYLSVASCGVGTSTPTSPLRSHTHTAHNFLSFIYFTSLTSPYLCVSYFPLPYY